MTQQLEPGQLEQDAAAEGQPVAGTASGAEGDPNAIEKVTIVSTDITRVGLHEKHPSHPHGEAFVGSEPVEVALTPYVRQRLELGVVRVVEGDNPVLREKMDRDREAAARQAYFDARDAARAHAANLRERAADERSTAAWNAQQAGAVRSPEEHMELANNSRQRAEELEDEAFATERNAHDEALKRAEEQVGSQSTEGAGGSPQNQSILNAPGGSGSRRSGRAQSATTTE